MKYAQGSFITVPSRLALNGLHPTAQTLYMWLCSYANESGTCFPSRSKLAGNCGCSENSIDRMLLLLQEKGLVKKRHQVKDGAHTSNLYTVMVVGSPTEQPPSPHTAPRVAPDVRTNSIQLTQPKELIGASREIKYLSPEEEKPKRTLKYPHHMEIFSLWKKVPRSWLNNNTQKQAAENLYEEHGIDEVRDALEWYEDMKERQKDNPHFYIVTSPWDLDIKWDKLNAFSEKKHD